MDKLYFSNNADENAEIDFQQMQLNISRNFAQLAEKLKPMYAELAKEMSKNIGHALTESLAKPLESIRITYTFSPEVIKAFQECIESYSKKFQFPQNNHEITVNLSNDDIKVINNFNININNYTVTDKSNESKKVFTYERVIAFLNLLLSIISLIHTDSNQPTCLCAETQQAVVQLQEQIDGTNNLIDKFVKQLNESTDDEITSDDSEVLNEEDYSDSE